MFTSADRIPDLYEQMHDIWYTIRNYDRENGQIVVRKLISDPDIWRTIFDLRDESLERLLSSLDSVTMPFQCLDATLLTNQFYLQVTQYSASDAASQLRRDLLENASDRASNPNPSGILIQERVT